MIKYLKNVLFLLLLFLSLSYSIKDHVNNKSNNLHIPKVNTIETKSNSKNNLRGDNGLMLMEDIDGFGEMIKQRVLIKQRGLWLVDAVEKKIEEVKKK